MPLDKSTLQSQLESLFNGPPTVEASCRQQWADAMNAYALGVVPPSTTVTVAATTLVDGLTGMSAPDAAAGIFEKAFLAFATTVGGGMAPAYAGTPPTKTEVGFAGIFANGTASSSSRAAELAGAIDTWMKTGQAVLNSPPGTTLTWT